MKKVFMFLGTCLLAALVVVSCSKKGGTPTPTPTPEPEPEPEPEESVIVIDGQFADWTAAASGVTTALLPDGCTKVSVLALKVTSDAENIYVYFEQELEEGQAASPFDFFLNTDGDDATGASTYLWTDAGWDYLVESEEGFLASATAVQDMDDMALYKFIGPDGADGWDDPDETDDIDAPYQERSEETGFAASAGVVENGIAKVEVSIKRSIFGKNLGGKDKIIKVGILLYEGDSWKDNGVLPQEEDGAVCAMMAVTLE